MSLYDVTANFAAIDGISSVAQGIGNSIVKMASDATAGLEGLSGALASVATGGLAILAAGAAVGIEQMDAVNGAMAGISARTNVTGTDLKQLEAVSKEVFKTGMVDSFDDVSKAAEGVFTKLRNYRSTSEDLQTLTTDVVAASKAWGVSSDTIIKSTQGIQDKFNNFKESPQQALDLLIATAQKSHLPLEQINTIVKRYGGTFADAGFSAQDFAGLLSKAGTEGVDNFAQLSTSIDSFQKSVSQPKPGFTQALHEMGLSSVVTDLKSNKIGMDQALDQVFTKFDQLPASVDKNRLAVELFGNSISKVGGADALARLKGFTDEMNNFDGSARTVANTMQDDGTLGTALRKAGDNFKTWLGDKAEEVWQRLKSIDWQQIGESIHEMATWAIGKWREFTANLESTVHTAITSVATWISAHAGDVTKSIQDVISGVSVVWKDITTTIKGGIEAAFSQASVAIDGFVGPIVTSVQGVITGVQNAWNTYFGPGSGLGKAVSDASTSVQKAFNDMKTIVKPITDDIANAINGILSAAQSVAGSISGAINAIASAIMTALKPVIDIVNGLTDAINHLPGGGGGGSGGSSGGGTGHPGHAMGGDLDEGWNVVGERGPELVNKAGTSATVFSNTESKKLLGAGGGSSGGNVYITVSAHTVVGSGGMDEFSRMIYRKFKDEDKRRGLTS